MINLIYTFDAKSWNLTQYQVVAGKQSSAPLLASIMLPPIIEHLKCLKLLYKVLATQSSIQQNH